MRLHIHHRTVYRYEEPALRLVQAFRLWPAQTGQVVRSWRVSIDGKRLEPTCTDGFGNTAATHAFDDPVESVTIEVEGVVETRDDGGVLGSEDEPLPPEFFLAGTALTAPSPGLAELAQDGGTLGVDDIPRLHALCKRVAEAVAYVPSRTHSATTADEALREGAGVCQDHAHVMTACARLMGYPARYVSGYLCAGAEDEAASHAWAEVHVDGLGWVGFDPANGISPDEHYVRVAVGRDYVDAAPVRGVRQGGAEESLDVMVRISKVERSQGQSQ